MIDEIPSHFHNELKYGLDSLCNRCMAELLKEESKTDQKLYTTQLLEELNNGGLCDHLDPDTSWLVMEYVYEVSKVSFQKFCLNFFEVLFDNVDFNSIRNTAHKLVIYKCVCLFGGCLLLVPAFRFVSGLSDQRTDSIYFWPHN